MSLTLREIRIAMIRDIISYELNDLGSSVSITGANSSGKSTILYALSLLNSNKIRDLTDIPVLPNQTKINPAEITLQVEYLFELKSKFNEILDSENFFLNFKAYFDEQIKRMQETIEKHENPEIIKDLESYIGTYRMILYELTNKGPTSKTFLDSLYETLRERAYRYGGYEDYKPAISGKNKFLDPDTIVDLTKFLKVRFEYDDSSGPGFKFSLLDKDEKKILSEELFYFWLQKLSIIDDEISFGLILGRTIFKSVIGNEQPTNRTGSSYALDNEGTNISDYIESLITSKPELLNQIKIHFKRIFNEEIEFKKGILNQSDLQERILVKIRGKWTPLDKFSDGMRRVLRILFQLEETKGYVLLIDEPELHLHPDAMKKLREILYENKNNTQIVCATHVALFIDPNYIDTLILNRKTGENYSPEILSAQEIDKALDEIGSSGLNSLFYEVIVWVEGPYDIPYIERFLDIFANEIKGNNRTKIGIQPIFGLKNMLIHMDLRNIKGINRKGIFVIDSDLKSATEDLNKEKKDFKKKCKKNNFECWITKRREVENYIPRDILETEFNLKPGTVKLGKYDDIEKSLKKSKKEIAKKTSKKITKKSISSNKEIYKEIKNFIKLINKTIKK